MRRGISQEALKVIACITMLLDHIGAVFVPGIGLRLIGRLSFPIYCFLLTEGAYHTRHPGKYALRLLIGAVLAELPFDYCFFGGIDIWHQSVMVTLLLGFGAVYCMRQVSNPWLKLLSAAPFVVLAYFAGCDYGYRGVILILLFALARDLPHRWLIQLVAMLVIFATMSSRTLFTVLGIRVTLQMAGALAIIPIALYSGEKRTGNRFVQWGFYLFYPVHMLVLQLLK